MSFYLAKKSEQIENEIKNEKIILQKIESEAITLKYETKIQYLDSEIEAYRSKIKKLLKVKFKLLNGKIK